VSLSRESAARMDLLEHMGQKVERGRMDRVGSRVYREIRESQETRATRVSRETMDPL